MTTWTFHRRKALSPGCGSPARATLCMRAANLKSLCASAMAAGDCPRTPQSLMTAARPGRHLRTTVRAETAGKGKLPNPPAANTTFWTPQRGSAYITYDRGTTWTNCQGLASGARVTADPVSPSRFYSFDGQAGKLMASTNAAATFAATAAELPTVQSGGRGGGGNVLAATTGIEGDLWVGSRSEGLYHSTDGGVSFTKVTSVSGADALGFGKAALGKTFPAVFLLGNINNLHARYRSDDASQTWIRIDDNQHQFGNANVPMIIGDPRIYGRVYFTTGGRGVIYGEINGGPAFGEK